MKLAQIWNAQQTLQALLALKKPPKLAYRLMKYWKKVQVEIEACEQLRLKCVYDAAGVEPPAQVNLDPGSPEYASFMEKFQEAMQGESDLEWSGVTMDELIETLGDQVGNTLSENDLQHLEPFFTAPEPLLKLVEGTQP